MTMTAEKQHEQIGASRGMEDHDYDLVQELARRLRFMWHCDQYIANAEKDAKLQNLWRDQPPGAGQHQTHQTANRRRGQKELLLTLLRSGTLECARRRAAGLAGGFFLGPGLSKNRGYSFTSGTIFCSSLGGRT